MVTMTMTKVVNMESLWAELKGLGEGEQTHGAVYEKHMCDMTFFQPSVQYIDLTIHEPKEGCFTICLA